MTAWEGFLVLVCTYYSYYKIHYLFSNFLLYSWAMYKVETCIKRGKNFMNPGIGILFLVWHGHIGYIVKMHFFSVLFYLEFFSYYKLFEMKVIKQKSKIHDTGCKGDRSESGRRVKGEVWNIVI